MHYRSQLRLVNQEVNTYAQNPKPLFLVIFPKNYINLASGFCMYSYKVEQKAALQMAA